MLQRQRGASYLGYLFGVIALIAALKIVVAVWPVYWDDYIINKQIIEVLKTNDTSISPTQFSSKMDEQLSLNNIQNTKFNDIAKVSNDEGQIQVAKHYEVRRHLFLNIDLILSFEKSFDQRTVQAK
ncbi:DUF4845 domain-containing protein [Acinetobacter sp.]|uniref:DUF4845 domain-containing protein n=1 Tax=Acinetobacter sp. TaxID=472 RepID=UPI0031D0F5B0